MNKLINRNINKLLLNKINLTYREKRKIERKMEPKMKGK